MKIECMLVFRATTISCVIENVDSVNQAIADFWETVAEEEGKEFAKSAKLFGSFNFWEVE